MPLQIAFCWSPECEAELQAKGFKKEEVYIKNFSYPGVSNSIDTCKQGDADFFRMAHKPYQFVTTSWWGAGRD